MPDKKSTLTYRWMREVWNNGREDAIDEMMAPDAEIHGINEITSQGTPGFKQFFRSFREQFPQINIEVEEVVTQDDLETSRCTVNATNAMGQHVNFSGMTCVRIKDDQIVEGWNNFDFLSMYKQLGFDMAKSAQATV
jgi:predicted ester cyclase